jgi:NAD-dependent dihydropyrimidine dehydrogenase PreA subunit
LDGWVEELIRAGRVFGVQKLNDRFQFAPLNCAADLRLDYDVALTAPKKYFLPAREELLSFQGAAGFETRLDTEPFILLGVHPYDVAAIRQMDAIFAKNNNDLHYLTRRNQATIVACDVQTAAANVFAGWMGTATVDRGFDILLTRIDDRYLVDSRTAKGDAILGRLAKAPPADAASLARREQVWENNRQGLRKHDLKVKLEKLSVLLEAGYDHPVWEEKAQRCFSCASCNTVCPTCYCFDVQDEVRWDLQGGVRTRTWDGCLLRDFATVAGGHNFRKNRADRYRHRYYRKGKYVPDKIGEIACVGCGRCIAACVSKIANPVEVYNRLLEVK